MPFYNNASIIYIALFLAETISDEPEIRLPLEPCSKYIVGVRVSDPKSNSTLPSQWLSIVTPYDEQAPPLNPKHKVLGRHVTFEWQHNCHRPNQQPSHYLFTVNDLALNRSTATEFTGLKFDYRMRKGGVYSFSISTPAFDAIPIVWNITAPPLPIPRGFNVTMKLNNVFEFTWNPIELHEDT